MKCSMACHSSSSGDYLIIDYINDKCSMQKCFKYLISTLQVSYNILQVLETFRGKQAAELLSNPHTKNVFLCSM